MNHSTPGLPVHYQLPESTQTHVHWAGDAIQPSHPLSSPSPPAFNLSQYQGSFQMSQLFISGGQSIGVSASTSVLPMNIQDWFPLGWNILKHKSFKDQVVFQTLSTFWQDYTEPLSCYWVLNVKKGGMDSAAFLKFLNLKGLRPSWRTSIRLTQPHLSPSPLFLESLMLLQPRSSLHALA